VRCCWKGRGEKVMEMEMIMPDCTEEDRVLNFMVLFQYH